MAILGHAPDSVLGYFVQNPNGSFGGYLAEVMAQPSLVVFTDSLRDQDRPIVSIDQLKSAVDLTPRRKSGSKILEISGSTILKVGWRVNMSEAETLILLAAKTNVPVPKVLSAYTIGDMGFILMSKIKGETLASCFQNISPDELHVIACQLKSYVLEWRKLESSFLGSVNGGPCQDILFRHPWDYKSTKQYGPFTSFEQYKLGVIEALRLSRPDGVWYENEEAHKEKILSVTHEISTCPGVLTHGDLHPGNIIIRDGLVSGIVDWGEPGYSLRRENSLQLSGLLWINLDRVARYATSSLQFRSVFGPFHDLYRLRP